MNLKERFFKEEYLYLIKLDFILYSIRLEDGIHIEEFQERYKTSLEYHHISEESLASLFNKIEDDGNIIISAENRLFITEKGKFVSYPLEKLKVIKKEKRGNKFQMMPVISLIITFVTTAITTALSYYYFTENKKISLANLSKDKKIERLSTSIDSLTKLYDSISTAKVDERNFKNGMKTTNAQNTD